MPIPSNRILVQMVTLNRKAILRTNFFSIDPKMTKLLAPSASLICFEFTKCRFCKIDQKIIFLRRFSALFLPSVTCANKMCMYRTNITNSYIEWRSFDVIHDVRGFCDVIACTGYPLRKCTHVCVHLNFMNETPFHSLKV